LDQADLTDLLQEECMNMNQYAMLTLSVDDEIVLSTHEIDTIEQLFRILNYPTPMKS